MARTSTTHATPVAELPGIWKSFCQEGHGAASGAQRPSAERAAGLSAAPRLPHCCLLPPPRDTSLYSTTWAYAGNNSVLSSHLPQPSRLYKCEFELLKSRKCSLVYFKIFCKQYCSWQETLSSGHAGELLQKPSLVGQCALLHFWTWIKPSTYQVM